MKYGSCFKMAFEALRQNPDSILVHALITNPSGRKITHGWIEFKNNLGQEMVYDASVDQLFSKDFFYLGYKPEFIIRYTLEMATAFGEESDVFGPWDVTLIKIMEKDKIPTRNESEQSRMWKKSLLKRGKTKWAF